MVELVVKLPKEIEEVLEKHPNIDWSGIAERAIKERIIQLKIFEEIVSKSELSEREAISIGKKIKKSLWERHYKKMV